MAAQPHLGETHDLQSLADGHRVFGRAAATAAARLDLDERQNPPLAGNDVDLAAPDTLVGGDDVVVASLQIANG